MKGGGGDDDQGWVDAEGVFREFVRNANPRTGEYDPPTQPDVALPEEDYPTDPVTGEAEITPTRPRAISAELAARIEAAGLGRRTPAGSDVERASAGEPRSDERVLGEPVVEEPVVVESVLVETHDESVLVETSDEEEEPWDWDSGSEPDSSEVVLLTRKKPGVHTQRTEAARVVPDVASVAPPPPPVPERSVDGQIPAGELDRVLSDMAVLLRYGHQAQAHHRLDQMLQRYPEDLLLLRRIAEFHMETGEYDRARERLFQLASGLFERRNLEGMRRALEQVCVIEPDNPRAARLLALLAQREDDTGT